MKISAECTTEVKCLCFSSKYHFSFISIIEYRMYMHMWRSIEDGLARLRLQAKLKFYFHDAFHYIKMTNYEANTQFFIFGRSKNRQAAAGIRKNALINVQSIETGIQARQDRFSHRPKMRSHFPALNLQ